jgi:DUF3040 family protein
VALSMDEEHILAEIEQRLAKSEPALAARLASFGRPGPRALLRSFRVRMLGYCALLVAITVVSLTAYALLPLRAMPARGAGGRSTSAPRHPTMIAAHKQAPPRLAGRQPATPAATPFR